MIRNNSGRCTKSLFLRHLFASGWRLPAMGFCLVFLMACADSAPEYIVEVNHQKLPTDLVIRHFKHTRSTVPGQPVHPRELKEFIDEKYLAGLLFQAEAYRLGLDQTPEARAEIERKKREILIGDDGVLYRTIIPEAIMVEEAELQKLYEQRDREIKIARIVVHAPALADSLAELLNKGSNFARLARRYSVDWPTARNGGVVPQYLIRGQDDPLLEKIVFQLGIGEISPPIPTAEGYLIVQVLDVKPRPRKRFERVRDTLLAQLQQMKRRLFLQNFVDGLFAEYEVSINDSLFPALRRVFSEDSDSLYLQAQALSPSMLAASVAVARSGQLTVGDFIHRYNRLPLRHRIPLRRPENLHYAVRNVFAEDLLYFKALDLGLDLDEKYDAAIRRVTDRVVEKLYREKYIEGQVEVSASEIETYLQEHAAEYRGLDPAVAHTTVANKLRAQKVAERERELRRQLQNQFIVRYRSRAMQLALQQINGNDENGG